MYGINGEEILTDNFGINRIFRLMNGTNAAISNLNLGDGLFLLEVDSGQITSNGYNYSLPQLFDEKVYSAQLMVREVDESGADDILASGWSPMLGGTVLLFSETTAPPIPPSTVLIQVLIRVISDSLAMPCFSFDN